MNLNQLIKLIESDDPADRRKAVVYLVDKHQRRMDLLWIIAHALMIIVGAAMMAVGLYNLGLINGGK